jgi:hypothetical protein
MSRKARLIWDALIVGALAVGVFTVAFAIGAPAHGAPIRLKSCATCAVRAPVLAPYVAPYVAPQVSYFVGAPLRMQAAENYTMEHAPEWAEFQAFKQFRAGYAAAQSQQQQSPTEPELPPRLTPAPTEGAPPTPAAASPWAAQIPTLVARCASCHSDANPDFSGAAAGGLYLDGTADILAPESWRHREGIMGAIVAGHMPKNGTLTDAEFGQILLELWGRRPNSD